MAAFGSFAILLGLVLCAYNFLVGAIALRQIAVHPQASFGSERLAESARRAGIGSFIALSAAAFALIYCAFTNDFSVSYILHHSNRALPWPYKFAALWSGQEGSLLLWAWLLAAYGFVLRVRHKVDVKLTAYASTILAAVQVFFTLLIVFPAPPFALTQGAVP
ncbi:MAG: heme lyase CcmF/NrfE family subunit, partial [Acidobacteriaceae bacterium]